MSYFLKMINRLNNPVERIAFYQKEDERIQVLIANLKAMNLMISTRYAVYDKTTKVDINALAEMYKRVFRDYRSYMIKESKKVDLPKTMIEINNRMIKESENFYVEHNTLLGELNKELAVYMKKQTGRKIVTQIYAQKNEYIDSFESRAEGVRAWECLVAIVEDGTIELKDLPSYGIDIDGIVID